MTILRYYQQEALDATFEYLTTHRGYDPVSGQPVEHNPLIAMPTGTGKSVVIAETCRTAVQYQPASRIVMATHSKELVRQNAAELVELWPSAPVGIISAGLRKKELGRQITFGGIGTLIGCAEQLGVVSILGVDEAHMISPNGTTMYRKFIDELKKKNPYLRVVGWSATCYRQGLGSLTEGGIFSKIVYDNTGLDQFNRLIAEGYLSPLIVKPTVTELDTSGVDISQGEFNQTQLQEAVDNEGVSRAALWEVVQAGWDRQSWLVFTSGVEHTEHCAEILRGFGVDAVAVHSKLHDKVNDKNIAAFKAGKIRCLVGNNMFTTGFNHRPVDLIAMLRPTRSTSLWVQMLGRGTRPSPETGKQNCLVLDFAGNAKVLGPINDPVIPKKRGSSEPGEMPVKLCAACGCYNHTRATICAVCGTEFEKHEKITDKAATVEVLASGVPEVETFDVTQITYQAHESKAKKHSLKVNYHCGLRLFREFVNIGHDGFAGKKARDWWRARAGWGPVPATVFEAAQQTQGLAVPKRIRVWVNKEHPEIVGYEY